MDNEDDTTLSLDKSSPHHKTTGFLFNPKDEKDEKDLDMRTAIPTKEMWELIHYYQSLARLGLDAGDNLKDDIEALLCSIQSARVSRSEQAVEVLKGREFPKIQRVRGSDEPTYDESTSSSQ